MVRTASFLRVKTYSISWFTIVYTNWIAKYVCIFWVHLLLNATSQEDSTFLISYNILHGTDSYLSNVWNDCKEMRENSLSQLLEIHRRLSLHPNGLLYFSIMKFTRPLTLSTCCSLEVTSRQYGADVKGTNNAKPLT